MSHLDRYTGSRLRTRPREANPPAPTVPLVRSGSQLRPARDANAAETDSQARRPARRPTTSATQSVPPLPPPTMPPPASPTPPTAPPAPATHPHFPVPDILPPPTFEPALPLSDRWRDGLWPRGDEGVNIPLESPAPALGVDPTADAYWDALSQIGGLFRLDEAQYVFQGWDEKTNALQVSVLTPSPVPID